ncbi:hypothetical protein SHIRM173S_03734 [Streptomyces hirsutus]
MPAVPAVPAGAAAGAHPSVQPSRSASASNAAGCAAASAAPRRTSAACPAACAARRTGAGAGARHGGTHASSAASRLGKIRPASRISSGARSAAPARSVPISVGSHGSSTASGSRPNAFDTASTTTSARPGTGSSACTKPLR